MAKNSDLKSVYLSLIDLAEAGDIRGAAFASRMSGPILGLMAHNVAKAKSANVETAPVETSAPVETAPVETSAPVETAPVETASGRKSRAASASA